MKRPERSFLKSLKRLGGSLLVSGFVLSSTIALFHNVNDLHHEISVPKISLEQTAQLNSKVSCVETQHCGVCALVDSARALHVAAPPSSIQNKLNSESHQISQTFVYTQSSIITPPARAPPLT